MLTPHGQISAGAGADSLSLDEIGQIFAPYAQKTLLLAVSGGPDSVAMMGMAALWRDHMRPAGHIRVATVDHGLRAESQGEAEQVARMAADFGLPHDILHWTGPKPETAVQDGARTARYQLLTQLAQAHNAIVLTAHTADDQAETILFRLLRGSGLSGLAGMQATIMRGAVQHDRPLLHVAKTRLIATCRAHHWSFAEDPSNVNPRYARARMRHLLPQLAAEGLTAASLNRFGARMAKADAVVDACLDGLWPDMVLKETSEYLELNMRPLADRPVLLMERAIQRALEVFAPQEWQRLERIERYAAELSLALAAGVSFRRSLGQFIFAFNGVSTVRIEPAGHRRRGVKRN